MTDDSITQYVQMKRVRRRYRKLCTDRLTPVGDSTLYDISAVCRTQTVQYVLYIQRHLMHLCYDHSTHRPWTPIAAQLQQTRSTQIELFLSVLALFATTVVVRQTHRCVIRTRQYLIVQVSACWQYWANVCSHATLLQALSVTSLKTQQKNPRMQWH